MNKIKIFCTWGIDVDLIHDEQIELYIDQVPHSPIPKNTIRFVCLVEPLGIMDKRQESLVYVNKTYNHLFTHDSTLLNKGVENIHLFEFGTTWIRGYEFPLKEFSISALVGGKLMTKGHHLRHGIWYKQNDINIPTRFFLSGANNNGVVNSLNNPVLGDNKSPLFDSQFHICIENVKNDNYFSEKLIDCLITKTVPIYWGCPNIGNWFDTRGIIIVDDIDDIIDVCNNLLGENVYNDMLPYIEDNYKRSIEYENLPNRLTAKILNLL